MGEFMKSNCDRVGRLIKSRCRMYQDIPFYCKLFHFIASDSILLLTSSNIYN